MTEYENGQQQQRERIRGQERESYDEQERESYDEQERERIREQERRINNEQQRRVNNEQQRRVNNQQRSTTNDNVSSNKNTHKDLDLQDNLIPRTTFKLKVGLVGDAQVGKTSLMVKYVQSVFDDEYIQTLGVHHLEKTEFLKYADILFVINDLGGQREFINMLPIVSEDAVAIVYMFDLTRPETLTSIKEWYRQAKGLNNKAISLLVGTKYDLFIEMDSEYQEKISKIATLYSQAMNAPLIFSSTSESINVKVIFKIIVAKSFNLKLTIKEIPEIGDPLLLYKNLGNKHRISH